ncbi:carbon-nitrogen hydrolase family protein [Pampinifervens florentissimum]|uniref:carbon-nitrogen hydrolase family protein n=1 Tax=Pampinifervens florentissimum TaxID=1632019 RepID=UPI0013B493D7|nr:carbon-nitrogen hydrolase family protein [Hydrogenobacter sp. T-8]QID32447.1 carbon-nitrogen hydrolase family protein [Hydrogenobacter sp. T-8]
MLNLAVLQFSPLLGKVKENLRMVLEMLSHVKEGSLVALPEMWQCGFDYENMERHAQATEEVLQEVIRISKERNLTIVGTYPIRTEGGIHNSAVVVDKGKVVGRRHKIKLFPLYEEPRHFLPGYENPVFETSLAKVGILICFELRFPELSWALRDAQLLVVPSMWGKKRKLHLMTLSRARAIENQCFLMLSNTWGDVGGEEYAGSSAIYGPWGHVLAFSERGDSILQVGVDLEEVQKVRRHIPVR